MTAATRSSEARGEPEASMRSATDPALQYSIAIQKSLSCDNMAVIR